MRARSIPAARRKVIVQTFPYIAAIGTQAVGTTGATSYPIPPTYQANDILLLAVEANQTAGLTAPAGWAHVTSSPKAQGTNVTSLNVLWKRATASETDPSVAATSDHQVGGIIVVRGCVTTGNPWDFTPTVGGAASSTAFSVAGGTSTVAKELVMCFAVSNIDAAADQFGAFTNASLANIIKQVVYSTASGNGGSIDVLTGEKSVAGATGTWTATMVSGTWAGLVLGLKPA